MLSPTVQPFLAGQALSLLLFKACPMRLECAGRGLKGQLGDQRRRIGGGIGQWAATAWRLALRAGLSSMDLLSFGLARSWRRLSISKC